MAGKTVFTCVCGEEKKVSNHWVLARRTAAGALGGVTFEPWDEYEACRHDVVPLCGPGCAAKCLSTVLQGWHVASTEAEPTIPYEPFRPEALAYSA
jgi:hypothetical protein